MFGHEKDEKIQYHDSDYWSAVIFNNNCGCYEVLQTTNTENGKFWSWNCATYELLETMLGETHEFHD